MIGQMDEWHIKSTDASHPQVFNTLTEVIQGPCVGNQQTLAHSRLWDAVGGFLFLFANMQDKLSKHSSQVPGKYPGIGRQVYRLGHLWIICSKLYSLESPIYTVDQ